MGEVPVEADRHAQPGGHVADQGDHDVGPAQPAAPGDRYGGDQRHERDDHKRPEADQDPGRLRAFRQRLRSAVGSGGLFEQGIRHRGTSWSINYAYVTVTYGTVDSQVRGMANR